MKLVIQIPCYNEQETLGIALDALPREVPGFDQVEWLVIDDGSQDETLRVAREHGVDHVVRFTRNQGLAAAFVAGLDRALSEGADVIVNTDADNQYRADDIPRLVEPILSGRADLVVGARPIASIEHFSPGKKLLQRLGSWVVRVASQTAVPDAPSGFRAMSRGAAMQLHVFSEYTYTLETLIQAGQKRMAVTSVPIGVNADLRPSRLVKSVLGYVRRSILVIGRIFVTYKPFAAFSWVGLSCFAVGFCLGLRFVYFYAVGEGQGHVQSVILSALLMGAGFFLCVTGIIADLISVNRKLLESLDVRLRELELGERARLTSQRRSGLSTPPESTPPTAEPSPQPGARRTGSRGGEVAALGSGREPARPAK